MFANSNRKMHKTHNRLQLSDWEFAFAFVYLGELFLQRVDNCSVSRGNDNNRVTTGFAFRTKVRWHKFQSARDDSAAATTPLQY